MSKSIINLDSTVFSRASRHYIPYTRKENRSSDARQNLNSSLDSCDIRIHNRENEKIKPFIVSVKRGDSLQTYGYGMKITSAPVTNLSLSTSLVVEPKLKRVCRQETAALPSLFISHNKVKKERAESVTLRAKNEILKKLPSGISHKSEETSKEKEELNNSRNKISVPGLLLNGNPLEFVRKSTISSVGLSDDSKTDQERDKMFVDVRGIKMKSLNLDRQISSTKSSYNKCNVSFDAINPKLGDLETKLRTKDERPMITLEQLKFKPAKAKEPINMSMLIRKFTNKRRKL